MENLTFENSSLMRNKVEKVVAESLDRIRQHPFILHANRQVLSKEQGERWIMCAGRESRSFPSILENMLGRCTNRHVKEVLAANLNDEYGNGNAEDAHFKHYLHLLDELGIPREQFYGYNERAGIKLALSLAYNISMQQSEALAIGYMLVNEEMTQITYSAAQNALWRYYSDIKTPFFQLHINVDAEHVEALYSAVEELEQTQYEDILLGVKIGERGMAVLLDEAYGLFDYCDEIPAYEPTL